MKRFIIGGPGVSTSARRSVDPVGVVILVVGRGERGLRGGAGGEPDDHFAEPFGKGYAPAAAVPLGATVHSVSNASPRLAVVLSVRACMSLPIWR